MENLVIYRKFSPLVNDSLYYYNSSVYNCINEKLIAGRAISHWRYQERVLTYNEGILFGITKA